MTDDEPPPPDYLKRIPATIPPGRIIVHNNARPTRRLGLRGFRAWYEPAARSSRLAICYCAWAPELGIHYIVPLLNIEPDEQKAINRRINRRIRRRLTGR